MWSFVFDFFHLAKLSMFVHVVVYMQYVYFFYCNLIFIAWIDHILFLLFINLRTFGLFTLFGYYE
jgi:hypothetical protein